MSNGLVENPLVEKIKYFFANLSATNIDLVDTFYHSEAHFIDPLVDLSGGSKIKAYYSHIYQPVEEIKFEFTDFICEGQKISAFWTMHLQAPKLNHGKLFSVPGISHLVFDPQTQLVKYQRDYYDVGDFIYERIPVLSIIIKWIKTKLNKY